MSVFNATYENLLDDGSVSKMVNPMGSVKSIPNGFSDWSDKSE